MRQTKLLIVGGGPAGYVAALRAAQLGAKPLLVEVAELGGTCLNRGCVPTKSLIESSGLYRAIAGATATQHGITVTGASVDLGVMVRRKEEVTRTLRDALGVLLPSRGIEIIPGRARFVGPREVAVQSGGAATTAGGGGHEERVSFEQAVICTGSSAWQPPIPGLELPGVIGSDEALVPTDVPPTLAVIGGGAVGCEFATIYASLGSKVTIIEMLPGLIPTEDAEMGQALQYYMEARGVRVITGARVELVERLDPASDVEAGGGAALRIRLATPSGPQTVDVARVLAAIGRRPNTAGLNLEAAGLAAGRRGEIPVDATMRTSVPGIFAAGDVTGGILLAHVAFEQGIVAVENALGRRSRFSQGIIPRCIYTDPEVSAVGMTEAAAREEGYEVAVGRFPFSNSGRALAMAKSEGLVKVVAESGSGQLLGVHIIGPHASELIAEAALALHHGSTIDDFAQVIHPHPTLTESVKEAVLDCRGEAIHK
ncbi:MAG TPA: dihydrolipoyl dehydrogenase [Bacillota bacterium]|jgi:dihydrolipoamide dehydrogenase